MEIRQARAEEVPCIMEIYANARRFMAEHGNPRQWGLSCWPPEERIRRDIAEGKLYVCLAQGEIAAVFFYAFGEQVEPDYQVITQGHWRAAGPYGVVHRIASAGTVRGAGAFCLNWAYERSGCHLRIDTHGDNHPMQDLLSRLGFERCGTIYVREDADPRLAYEKVELPPGLPL